MTPELQAQLGQELYSCLREPVSRNWSDLSDGERDRLTRAACALYKIGFFHATRHLQDRYAAL